MLTAIAVSLAIGPALRSLSGVGLPPSNSSQFEFVVMGDNRPAGPGMGATDVFKQTLREVSWIHPNFVISSGDLLYGKEESLAAYQKEADEVAGLLRQLGVPFFNAPGNHEISERPEFAAEYVKRFGPLYGSFEYGGWRFVALCSEELGSSPGLSPTQNEWLGGLLKQLEPTVVFLHRPVFARPGNDEEGKTVAKPEALHALFRASDVKGVFEGHDHVCNHQTHDGVEYWISGGAGAPLDALPQDGGFFHYLVVKVNGDHMQVDVVPSGSIQVRHEGNNVEIGNYSDVDIELADFTVTTDKVPTTFKVYNQKSGKAKDVDVRVVQTEKTVAGVVSRLAFTLVKHRMTVVAPNY